MNKINDINVSMIKKLRCAILLLCIITFATAEGQEYSVARMMWWNVENLFDPSNDSLTADDEFTTTGTKHWTYNRFYQKKDSIYKTILYMGINRLPVAIGLCEVENDWVLRQLCLNTPLRKFNYDFVHYDSPDTRGIDVALLYKVDRFEVLYSQPIAVKDSADTTFNTRDILLVKGVIKDMDTVFLLLAHFPSKLQGDISEKRRSLAAAVMAYTLDTIVAQNTEPKIVIMGDFNDAPDAKCITEVMKILPQKDETANMINLMANYPAGEGTYKYDGFWECLDQVMISRNLYPQYSTSIEVVDGKANIYKPNFLLMPDNKYWGMKLYRTYNGPIYKGGFSDHLPVYIDIKKRKNR